jgi:hypothetical protein
MTKPSATPRNEQRLHPGQRTCQPPVARSQLGQKATSGFGQALLCRARVPPPASHRLADISVVRRAGWKTSGGRREALDSSTYVDLDFRERDPSANDFVTARAHSMKRSTTGLKVRFFRVVITTGHGRTGKSTGNTLSELWTTPDRGYAVMNGPLARKSIMSGKERVTSAALGMASPRARKASFKRL